MPEVTVVVPTHNRLPLLLQTVGSILAQRDIDFDVVVVDDGSDDGTREALWELNAPRLRILRHATPQGVSAARNAGIAAAGAPWIAFCDDDDVWAPHKLWRQLAAADTAGWVICGAVRIDMAGRPLGIATPSPTSELLRRLPRFNVIPGGCSGVIARRMLLESVGGFDSRLVNLADWDLWLRLAAAGPPAIVHEPLVAYRIHGSQRSLDTELIVHEARLVRQRGIRVDWGALHQYLAHVNLRAGRRRAAFRHFVVAAAAGAAWPVVVDLWQLFRPRRAPEIDRAWSARVQAWMSPA